VSKGRCTLPYAGFEHEKMAIQMALKGLQHVYAHMYTVAFLTWPQVMKQKLFRTWLQNG
jgi:hypothetical protein